MIRIRTAIFCSILVVLCTQTVLCAPASVSEGSISIPVYAYEDGLYTPLPDDRLTGYPYPALKFNKVASKPTPRDYRTVVLENDYLKVVILPDLGGRIYRLIYKPTGQSVLYENEPLKPNIWTEQSWWMSTGGMEWCFPLTEHSSNTLQPWSYSIREHEDGSATVTVSDTHRRTGLTESVGITLKPDSCALHLFIRVSNPNITPKPWMFWINPMIPANDEVELIVPAKEMDTFGGTKKLWPINKQGKDRRLLKNWDDYDSLFALDLQAGFAGMFDHSRDLGFVRTFPLDKACGVKIFSFGHSKQPTLQPKKYSDAEKPYFELWGGYTRTFEITDTLPAHGSVEWQEQWYPVACNGGYKHASAKLAADYQLDRTQPGYKSAHITLFPSCNVPCADIIVGVDGKLISRWKKDLKCGQTVEFDTEFYSDYSPAYLLVKQGSRTVLRCYIEELRERPKKEEPKQDADEEQELVKKKPVIPPPTLAELVQTDRLEEAIKLYESTHPKGPEAATYYGIALMRTGRYDKALKSFTDAARCKSATSLPAYLAGVICLKNIEFDKANEWFSEAVRKDNRDTQALNAAKCYGEALTYEPNSIVATLEYEYQKDEDPDVSRIKRVLGPDGENYLLEAMDYMEFAKLGPGDHALKVACENEPNNITALAAMAVRLGNDLRAKECLAKIHDVNMDDAIVYGSDQSVMILEEALRAYPNDSRLMLYLAMAYQSRKSYQAAFDMAEKAAQVEPTLARAYLIQAQALYRIPKTEENREKLDRQAAEYMDKCLALNPTHPGCYYFAGWMYRNVYRERAQVAALKKLYELDPHNHLSWECLGREAMWEKQDYGEAVDWFTMLAESQDHDRGYMWLGYAYRMWVVVLAREKQYAKAVETAAKADEVELDWTLLEYTIAKAEALEATGKSNEARKVLEEARPKCEELLNSEWLGNWYEAGCVYEKLGEKEQATKAWQKALAKAQENLKLSPNEKWWNYNIAQSLYKLGKPKEALEAISVLKPENTRWYGMKWLYEDIKAAAKQSTDGQ